MSRIKEINEEIFKLEKEREGLLKIEEIESYNNRQGLLGRCFKDENHFYKVIDLDKNPLWCHCLVVEKFGFGHEKARITTEFGSSRPAVDSYLHLENLLGIDSIVIGVLKTKEEISLESFEAVYRDMTDEILNIETKLWTWRQESYQNWREENNI